MSLAQQLLRKVPQYTRHERHIRSVMQHGSPRKWANLAHAELERIQRRIVVKSRPYLLFIDPSNFCNLRCPLCPTGLNDLGREQSMLGFENFQRWFDPHAPFLFEAYLHNWGESLLNKDVYRMIDHVQRKDVGTNLSSNLVIATSEDLDNLIDSGLEYLVVSLDGTSAESYLKYRIRGDYDKVVSNMAELIRRRNARGSKTPVVEWQFIVMKTNEHEVEEAERMAKKLGVDVMRFIPVGMPFEFRDRQDVADLWYPTQHEGRKRKEEGTEQQFGQADKPSPCFYLYRSMVVNPDGGVSPCCVVYRKNRDFAQLDDKPVDVQAVWNNEKYQSARSLFSDKKIDKRRPTVCDTCDIFAFHPSKGKPIGRPPATATIEIHRQKPPVS